jgi:hypothetical protein
MNNLEIYNFILKSDKRLLLIIIVSVFYFIIYYILYNTYTLPDNKKLIYYFIDGYKQKKGI